MYRKLLLYISILLGFTLYGRTPGEVPNVHVANASAWVSDPDGIMSPEARRHADFYLQRLQDSLTVEVPVVIVANLSGQHLGLYVAYS